MPGPRCLPAGKQPLRQVIAGNARKTAYGGTHLPRLPRGEGEAPADWASP
jgi:hypothetical protein